MEPRRDVLEIRRTAHVSGTAKSNGTTRKISQGVTKLPAGNGDILNILLFYSFPARISQLMYHHKISGVRCFKKNG